MLEDILTKILSDKASDDEKQLFYDEAFQDDEKLDAYCRTKNLWVSTSARRKDAKLNLDNEYSRLLAQISVPKRNKVVDFGRRFLARAALFILLLGAGWGAHQWFTVGKHSYNLSQKFVSTVGSVSQVTLPDGSEIWLNSGSEADYTQTSKGRNIKLTGEACFDVVHNDKLPFLVHASGIVIRDLGTRFNVRAYPRDDQVEATLIRGNADILTSQLNPIYNLKPGEIATYDKVKRSLSVEKVDPATIVAWMDGKFVFRNEKLVDICDELEKWYGVKFKFQEDTLRNFRYTANIKRSISISYVLKMLNITTHLHYRIIENKIEPDMIILSKSKVKQPD